MMEFLIEFFRPLNTAMDSKWWDLWLLGLIPPIAFMIYDTRRELRKRRARAKRRMMAK